jgi:hypothetical protein
MPTATSRKALPEATEADKPAPESKVIGQGLPQSEAELHALEVELIALHRKYHWSEEDARRYAQIAAVLKGIQPKGTSHRDTFTDLGMITVAGYTDPEEKRAEPEVDVRRWDGLTDEQRKAELARGLIKLKTPTARANYGKVDIELF